MPAAADRRLVQLGAQVGLDHDGAARPLGMVRSSPRSALVVPRARWSPASAGRLDLFAQPRRLGPVPGASSSSAAADRVRLGLCRHAARPLSSSRSRWSRSASREQATLALLRGRRHRRPALRPASAPAATTVSMWLYDRAYDRELAALDHVPRGARLVSFVGRQLRRALGDDPAAAPPGLAIVRRDAFSNDQWSMAGAQLLTRPLSSRGWRFIARSVAAGASPRPLPRRGLADRSTRRSPSSRATPSTMSG